MDFGPADAAFFPIHPRKGGPGFGFCPGKATWYPDAKNLFDLLVLAAETGQPLFSGGLAEQPDWAIEKLAWFLPEYREMQFAKRAKAIFGTKDETPNDGKKNGPNHR